jgi:hypothetical protein
VGLLGLGGIGFCLFLHSAAGSRWILAQATRQARAAGIDLSFREGRVDPFSTLYLRDLHLSQKTADRQMDVRIPLVEIRYAIAPFSRRIDVTVFHVDHPAIYLRSTSPAVAAAAPSPAPAQPSASSKGLAFASNWVTSPPLRVFVNQFALDGLSLDIETHTGPSSLTAKIEGMQAHASLSLLPRHLKCQGDWSLAPSSQVAVETVAESGTTAIRVSPHARAHWSAGITEQDGKWVYEIEPTQARLGTPIEMTQTGAAGKSAHWKIGGVDIRSDLRLLVRSSRLFQLDPNSFQSVELHNRLTTGAIDGEMRRGDRQTRVHLDDQQLDADATLAENLALVFAAHSRAVSAPAFLARPVDARMKATATINRELTSLQGQADAVLGDLPVLQGQLRAQAADGSSATLNASAVAGIDVKLASLLTAAAALKSVGTTRADITLRSNLTGQFASLSDAAIGAATSPAKAWFEVVLSQIAPAGAPPKRGKKTAAQPIAFDPIHLATEFDHADDKLTFKVDVRSPHLRAAKSTLRDLASTAEGQYSDREVKAKITATLGEALSPSLHKPVTAEMAAAASYRPATGDVGVDGALKVQNDEALRFKIVSATQGDQLTCDATLVAMIGNYLDAFLPPATLAKVGHWRLESAFKASGNRPEQGSFATAGTFHGDGTTSVHQIPLGQASPTVRFADPIVLHHKVDLDRGNASLALGADVPSIELASVGKISGTHLEATVHSPDLGSAAEIDFAAQVHQGDVHLVTKGAPAPPLTGLEAAIQATLRNRDQFQLEKLTAAFNRSLLTMTADASGRVKTQDFQARGQFRVQVPADFPPVAGQRFQGTIGFPWNLSVRRGRDINFTGNVALADIGWSKTGQHVSGISGSVPVSESLVRDGKHIRFAYLITQNPFERVDYERLRPLIHSADQVKIDEIGIEEKRYGPLVGYFSLRQNLLFAHQFDFTLGSTGLVYGEMYFNAYPGSLQLGFLTRLTALDLADILPHKYLLKVPPGDKKLSGRSGLVINLNKGSVDGRVDVTEIGAAQLLTLVNVLDPKYEDDKMNLVRSALGVGAPTFVEMSFQNGYMDLGVDLDVLGLTKHFDVRGIPFSTFVSSATAGIVRKTRESPLQR